MMEQIDLEKEFMRLLRETEKGAQVADNAGLNMVRFRDDEEEKKPFVMLDGHFQSDDLREIARAFDAVMVLRDTGGVEC